VFRKQKPRKNKRKGKKAKRRFTFLGRFLLIFKIIFALGALTATSGLLSPLKAISGFRKNGLSIRLRFARA
jgi:hypothetical protein